MGRAIIKITKDSFNEVMSLPADTRLIDFTTCVRDQTYQFVIDTHEAPDTSEGYQLSEWLPRFTTVTHLVEKRLKELLEKSADKPCNSEIVIGYWSK